MSADKLLQSAGTMTPEEWAEGRRTVERLDKLLEHRNVELKDAAIRGDFPYVPFRWTLEEAIRDQYFAPGTRFTLTADVQLDERGGIQILSTHFHVVSTGTFIDPSP